MRRDRLTMFMLTLCLLSVIAMGIPAQSKPAAGEPPFSRGMKWTYRDRRPSASGEIRSGTITITYGGAVTYRGARRFFMDASYSLRPGTAERLYLDWAGTHFRQVANVITNDQKSVLEVVFDRPFRIRVNENASGTVQILENGTPKTSAPWMYVSAAQGTTKVTVPAGTFRASRWDARLKIADREMRTRYFTVGHTDIRWETTALAAGGETGMTSVELVSGPVK